MDAAVKVGLRDVLSHAGRDWLVEALLTYRLADRTLRFARLADGAASALMALPGDREDQRWLLFQEITDFPFVPPPPASVQYRDATFVVRLEGEAAVSIALPGHPSTQSVCTLWRYRAAGDVFLQIERWPTGSKAWYGQSILEGLVDHFPSDAAAS